MNLDLVAQFGIIVAGASSVWLMAQRQRWRRWGYIAGMCGQPFWVCTTLHHGQYLVLALTGWYTYSWGQGIWNFWIRPQTAPEAPHAHDGGATVELEPAATPAPPS